MRKKLLRLSKHRHVRTTVKYGMVSVIATIIDFVVLNGGIKFLHMNPQLAKTAAFGTATLASFPLQQRWVFRADPTDSSTKQWVQYLAASITGYAASVGCITLVTRWYPGNLLFINLANWLGFGTVWLFKLVFFQKVVFAPSGPGDEAADVESVHAEAGNV